MTRVCLVGEDDVHLQYELLSRETARDALAAYDLREPYENSIAVETVSLGAAVALLNDLNWYLIRFVDDAFVLEPSVSETEWLSRDLATAIRNDERDPDQTGRFLRVYGIEYDGDGESGRDATGAGSGRSDEQQSSHGSGDDQAGSQSNRARSADRASGRGDDADSPGTEATRPRLVEPMLVARTDEQVPAYDLRDVDDTLVVRVTEAEFGA